MIERTGTDAMDDGAANAQGPLESVRRKLLVSGLYDWVPLIQVEDVCSEYGSTAGGGLELAYRAVRSLLEDGLMEVGDSVTATGQLRAWEVPIDECMQRVRELRVDPSTDTQASIFRVWLSLTERGERVARQFEKEEQA
ncbi:MAG: hypothetical protein U0R77_07330 [Mycolicibacterium insubricum]|uniref:hypothetical protein n=2 Tax=Mycolicibacterium insubricum TaxID=444597 RepID=UPI0010549180|nr:hypothetical protein [Mycolicibacterium insubricum]BBZ67160.1 hypothetical protein MINS_25890 [Mycolicibacterium insubricum]